MLSIKKILYATDFSETADSALPFAIWFAERYEAEFHMLHAIVLHADDPHDPAHHFPDPDGVLGELEDRAERLMRTKTEPHDAEMVVHRAQIRGIAPAPVILEYADDNDIDLIVLGTHGRRGLRHFFLGSVVEEVIRSANCPVLTVRHADDGPADGPIERITVPIDYSEHSDLALAYAKEIAAVEDATLDLLHILEVGTYPDFYFPVTASKLLDIPALKEEALGFMGRRVKAVGGPEVKSELHAEPGQPAHGITDFAEEEGRADLIVIASHGRTGLSRVLLGSVAEGVIRNATCPVFIVKSFGRHLLPDDGAAKDAQEVGAGS